MGEEVKIEGSGTFDAKNLVLKCANEINDDHAVLIVVRSKSGEYSSYNTSMSYEQYAGFVAILSRIRDSNSGIPVC